MTMHSVYLLVGGNLDNTHAKYERLFVLLEKHIGKIIDKSQFYESSSWGYESAHLFINMAICIETELSPKALIKETQRIESLFGRAKTTSNQYKDRIMDIDIIFYDDIILDTEDLQIPHPRMHLRNFVLYPLAEICPELVHPVFKKDVGRLKAECGDEGEVVIILCTFAPALLQNNNQIIIDMSKEKEVKSENL